MLAQRGLADCWGFSVLLLDLYLRKIKYLEVTAVVIYHSINKIQLN